MIDATDNCGPLECVATIFLCEKKRERLKNATSSNVETQMTGLTIEHAVSETASCRRCGAKDQLRFTDGDTISAIAPDARSAAKGRALSWRGYSYLAVLGRGVCNQCSGESAQITINLIDNPAISSDWADAYFCKNQHTPERPTFLNATCQTAQERGFGSWSISCTQTKAGLYTEHFFGPVIAPEPLEGPYGVARCMGGTIWEEAATLVLSILPIIATTAFRTKCLTRMSNPRARSIDTP
jgi:hypothetical protein